MWIRFITYNCRENSASEDELDSEVDNREELLPNGANDQERMSSLPVEGEYTTLTTIL